MSVDDREHWVYRLFDKDNVLLYIGSTCNLRRRLRQHLASKTWASRIQDVEARQYPNGRVARYFERTAIRTEHPRFNVTSRARPTVTQRPS